MDQLATQDFKAAKVNDVLEKEVSSNRLGKQYKPDFVNDVLSNAGEKDYEEEQDEKFLK